MFVTTALFNQLVREKPDIFAGMKQVLFGGEAVNPHWVRTVINSKPPQRLLHVYGPTESTTFAAWYLIEAVPDDATTIPIGKPLANTQLYVLDAHLQPAPIGVPGELYIGGDGLALGYLNRSELTATKFIPNPFSHEPAESPGARLYKTGDKVRLLPDGNFEFLGRFDQQVKLRGFRIELGEIEATLIRHESVREAVVLCRQDQPGEKRIVAYLVNKAGCDPSPDQLCAHLRKQLPAYMLPSAFVFLASMPLNRNGKVDRTALPEPDSSHVLSSSVYLPPRNNTEQQIVDIWCDLLGVKQVGVDRNFFELGGHSLLATQVVSRINRDFQLELPVRLLFDQPTIASLAVHIDALGKLAKLLPRRGPVKAPVDVNGVVYEEEEGEL